MTTSWFEIDCPVCGIDYDFDPVKPGDLLPECCGRRFTADDMRTANFYDEHCNVIANPFGEQA